MHQDSPETSFDAEDLLQQHLLDVLVVLPAPPLPRHSPVKAAPKTAFPTTPTSLTSGGIPDLACLFLAPTDLFLVTQSLRDDRLLFDKLLFSDKINGLLTLLQANNESLELDDTLRTRVFRGRMRDGLDSFDMQLDAFLERLPTKHGARNENKENVLPVEPLKRKLSDSLTKTPLKRVRSYTQMPLAPAPGQNNNVRNRPGPKATTKATAAKATPLKTAARHRLPRGSPQRVCTPSSTLPGRPCLKIRPGLSIYVVDSLTGLVRDATQFGTELNLLNCEGFPLPDNPNEVVQIPTNESVLASAEQKMAIIKAINGPRRVRLLQARKGFYTRREFEQTKLLDRPVSVYSSKSKAVRWADDLEW